MICDKCGKDYPNKIWKIHTKICKGSEVKKDYKSMKYNELRKEAKKLDLVFDKNPNTEELIKALETIE